MGSESCPVYSAGCSVAAAVLADPVDVVAASAGEMLVSCWSSSYNGTLDEETRALFMNMICVPRKAIL